MRREKEKRGERGCASSSPKTLGGRHGGAWGAGRGAREGPGTQSRRAGGPRGPGEAERGGWAAINRGCGRARQPGPGRPHKPMAAGESGEGGGRRPGAGGRGTGGGREGEGEGEGGQAGTWSTLVADILHGEPRSPRSAWASSGRSHAARPPPPPPPPPRPPRSPPRRLIVPAGGSRPAGRSAASPPCSRSGLRFPTMADGLRLSLPLGGALTFRSPSAGGAADLSLPGPASMSRGGRGGSGDALPAA